MRSASSSESERAETFAGDRAACIPVAVAIEYDVHGKIVATGSSHDNRFISVVTIEGRKIVQWRDYMDSLATMTALSQVSS